MKRGGKEFFIGGKISHTRVRALLVGVYENKETHLCGPWPTKRTSTMLTLCLKFLTRPRHYRQPSRSRYRRPRLPRQKIC